MPVRTVDNPRMTVMARNMAKLLKMRLLVGIPGGTQHPGSKASNAVIGYVQDQGDDELHIPARPFLVPGIESVKDQVADKMELAAATVLAGGPVDAAERPMMAAGLIAQSAIQQRITDGPFTTLAASTLRARKARGRTGDKPLIDTGALRQSITYVIDKG